MLRIGVIGCGKIADAHVEQVRAIGRGAVVAACDSEPLMAEQLSVRMRIPNAYTDLSSMLRRERLDVVHVATPPHSHARIACESLAFGCHVFLEKPFALTAEDASRILECAKGVGKRVSVNYHFNFSVPALELRRLLSAGALGEVVHFDTTFGYDLAGAYGMAVLSDPDHWVHRLPGGLFHNVLDHSLANVVEHLSDDVAVQVIGFRRRPRTGHATFDALDDELRFLLKSGSVTVFGLVSAHARPVAHTLRAVGTRDTVEVDQVSRTIVQSARQVHRSTMGSLMSPWVQARHFARNGWRNLRRFGRNEFHYFQGMRVLLNQFYDAIELGGADPISAQHVLRTCRVVDMIVGHMDNGT